MFNGKYKISHQTFALATTFVYAAIVSIFSFVHVVWRDETTPLNIVAYSSSLPQLFANLCGIAYTGHPGLWYFFLYVGYHIFHSHSVLKIVNLIICVSGVYIFLRFSPFTRLQKVLFILGFFPFFYYPVFSRNYGISMLFAFAFAALYHLRFKKMLLLGAVLFLLSNTHAHSLIMAFGILAALALEALISPEARRAWGTHFSETSAAFMLVAVGIICSFIIIMPPQTSIEFNPQHQHITVKEIIKPLLKSIIAPGKAFPNVLGVDSWIFCTLVIFGMYIYLLPKPVLLALFGVTVFGLNMFNYLVFPSEDMRHQGAFYLLMVTTLWLDHGVPPNYSSGNILSRFRDSIAPYKEPLFIFLLILQVCLALPEIKGDLSTPYSSSKGLAQILNDDPQFKNAILVGEPPRLGSVSYYADNAIYLPRESRFSNFISITTAQQLHFTLNDLLNVGESIRRKTGQKVLFAVAHKLSDQGPFTISMTKGRDFSYTKDSLAEFERRTKRIAIFNGAASDENYSVYLLK